MTEHTKKYDTLEEMHIALKAMRKFQLIHNIIRKDYFELLKATEDNKEIETTFDALYRASLRSLFTVIEADITGLNSLDQYPNYNNYDKFIKKFKNTYIQIAKTWDKVEIQERYFNTKLEHLLELKKKRDELVHPKEIEHIHKATELDFEKLKNVFNGYDSFINELMDEFFLGTTVQYPYI